MEEDTKIICPVCEHVISDFDEGVFDPCEHVMLSYTDACTGEFVHVGKGFKEIAEEMEAKFADWDSDEYAEINELMEKYAEENKGFELSEMTTYGMACGPCSNTEYHLIKTS
jgi:hypothetical protein